ncbi:MAG: thioredoxin [Elusimicrobiota bacterium]|jgi:thioredoxin 1
MALDIQVTDDTFDKDVMQSPQPVVVDFWAPWCGPCRMIAPVLEELAKEYAGKVRVGKVNVDENPGVQTRFHIQAIPTLLFFKAGKLVDQVQGMLPKAEIKKRFDTLIAAR